MDFSSLIPIAVGFTAICIIVIACVIGRCIEGYILHKQQLIQIEEKRMVLEERKVKILEKESENKEKELRLQKEALQMKQKKADNIASLQYSKDMLEFLRTVIATVTVLKFKDFCDHHPQFDKVSESNVRSFAGDVAISVNEFINRNNITFDDALFTESFYNHYLIETCFTYVKDLVDKKIDSIMGG